MMMMIIIVLLLLLLLIIIIIIITNASKQAIAVPIKYVLHTIIFVIFIKLQLN